MAFASLEFESILSDDSKYIDSDISWSEDEDHSPSVEFPVEVRSREGLPLFVKGSYNPLIPALSYSLILKTVGRIYGLDLGKDHHNPECNQVGEKHKHKWTEQSRDKWAYAPEDITEPPSNPVGVWNQFCSEANIKHSGKIFEPPQFQHDLFL
ncbi:MAG: hypothetical protein NUW37_03625 [Planctomycetes bacterium]|nr:hypothetical protein [Planctomycetota bacterium]